MYLCNMYHSLPFKIRQLNLYWENLRLLQQRINPWICFTTRNLEQWRKEKKAIKMLNGTVIIMSWSSAPRWNKERQDFFWQELVVLDYRELGLMRASNCRCQIQLARSLVLWIWSKLKGGSGRKEDRSPICNEVLVLVDHPWRQIVLVMSNVYLAV